MVRLRCQRVKPVLRLKREQKCEAATDSECKLVTQRSPVSGFNEQTSSWTKSMLVNTSSTVAVYETPSSLVHLER